MQNEIVVRCRTNVDCARGLQWPTLLPGEPQIGDAIRCRSKTSSGGPIDMKVDSRMWRFDDLFNVWVLEVWLVYDFACFNGVKEFEAYVKGD